MKYVATIRKIIELKEMLDRLWKLTDEGLIPDDTSDTMEEIICHEMSDRAQRLYEWLHEETLTKEIRTCRRHQIKLACRLLKVDKFEILRYRTW